MNDEAYQQALEYLYSHVDFSLVRGFRYNPDQFDLGRMFLFMEKLGNPERDYPIIHVAGTKGKGSVSALCANALRQAGYRVGLYTSPHLHDYAERIQVDGQPITHAEMVALLEEIKPIIESIPALTTFEITTALGLLYFSRQSATAAVVEVGLGGRLDASNVVTPLVSVITSISYDHTQVLGSTLSQIAGEKAGIIKPGVPVVSAPQAEEARRVIEAVSNEREAPYIQVGREYGFQEGAHSLESGQAHSLRSEPVLNIMKEQAFTVWRNEPTIAQELELSIPLLGAHQVANAATAYAVLQTANERGLSVSPEALKAGFSKVFWPGRFEILQMQPPVVVDCAHNRDSALKLRQTLDDYFPEMKVILVFGASEDKDIEGMFAELLPRVEQVIVTRSFHPRAADPETLVRLASEMGKQTVMAVEKVEDALEEALRLSQSRAMVLATGSIFIAAAVRETWLVRHGINVYRSEKL
jgi:dihydrofolate synthase / folylpolyglutamate synthase